MGLFDDIIGASASGGDFGSIPVHGRALLETIYGGESNGYDQMYGGGRFADYSDHPRQRNLIMSGPNAGKYSTAAGAPQYLEGTWDEVKREANLPDFSPKSQNEGAWHLAQRDYRTSSGRDLDADLKLAAGDPGKAAMIASYLAGTWTSLPGGIEPNSATNSFGKRYAQNYQRASAGGPGLFDDILTTKAPIEAMAGPTDMGGYSPEQVSATGKQQARADNIGYGTAGLVGGAKGLTANWQDEAAGVMAASGMNPLTQAALGPLNALVTPNVAAARLGYEALTGKGKATEAYETQRDKVRSLTAQSEQQYPGTTLAAEVGGAIANPLTRAAPAATLGGRALQGAGIGAVYGGASGAGEGTTTGERLSKGATGATVGALTGGIGVPVAEGLVGGAQALARPITSAVRGMANPEAEAARRVTGALERDMRTGGDGLTPAGFQGARNAGAPVTIADMGGETTRGVARSAANTSPEGRAALQNLANARFEGQADRATTFINRLVGGVDTETAREGLRAQARQVNTPAYYRVMGAHPVVSVPAEIMERPVVAQAMKDAVSLAKNFGEKIKGPPEVRTILSGPGYHIADDVPNSAKTSLRYWDYVKKALDARMEGMKRKGGIEDLNGQQVADFRGLADARRVLVEHLDKTAPGYREARAGAARFFGAEDALTAGANFVKSSMTAREGARAVAQMTPAERGLFRQGFASQLIDDIGKVSDRRNVIETIGRSREAQTKIQLALGRNGAEQVQGFLTVERAMDRLRTAVQGNSTTARQLVELGLAGGVGGISTYHGDPAAMVHAAAVYGLLRGHRAIDQRVAQRVAQMLTSNDPNVLARGVQMATRNQTIMRAFREVDSRLGAVGGQQGTGVPALQSMGYGRAQEDQPNVNRPFGQ